MTEEEIAAAKLAAEAKTTAEAERILAEDAVRVVKEKAEREKADPKAVAAEQEIADLKASLAAAIEAAAASAAKFKGVDPEKAKADAKKVTDAEAAARAAEKSAAETAGNWERMRELMNEERDAEKKILGDQRDAALADAAAIKAKLGKAQVINAFSTSDFVSKETILTGSKAERLYGDHVEVIDDVLIFYDKPEGSLNRTKMIDSKGASLSFDIAIKKIIEADPDKDTLLRSKASPGAGSKTEDGKSIYDGPKEDRQARIARGLRELQNK